MKITEAEFSTARLDGAPVPSDVAALLNHSDELARQTGVLLTAQVGWAPWADVSYLTEAERTTPDIAANIAAIAEVCGMISFVASDDQANYYGYWRGPARASLEDSPVVQFDNEGQFYLCGTANLAGALLAYCCHAESFQRVRDWMDGLGIQSLPESPYDLGDPRPDPSPSDLHRTLYEKYLRSPGRA